MSLPFITHPELDESRLKSKGVSLVAFFDEVRKRKDDTASIKLRIVYQRFPKYYGIKVSSTKEVYEKIASGGKSEDVRNKRIIIFENLKKAYDIIITLPTFSFEAFERKFKNKTTSNDIFIYFDNYISQLKLEERIGSAVSYEYAKKKLEEYTKKQKLTFETISVPFLNKFEKWMITEGLSPTTVGYYCRCYKSLYNQAIRDGNAFLENYPFGDIKKGLYAPPSPRNIKKAIPIDAIQKLFEYQPEEKSPEHYHKDLWVFSYLGNGINVKDICLLQNKHIVGDSIVFNRAKTTNTNRKGKPIQISLIDQNKAIIDRWGTISDDKEEYIFPILKKGMIASEQHKRVKQLTKQINKYMKRIASNLKLDLNVTTYVARHSFATVLKRSGVGIEYISESLGHSDLKVTENYLDSFEDETRVANTKKLLDF